MDDLVGKCPLCYEAPTSYHVLNCGHGGCAKCLDEFLTKDPSPVKRCFICRANITFINPSYIHEQTQSDASTRLSTWKPSYVSTNPGESAYSNVEALELLYGNDDESDEEDDEEEEPDDEADDHVVQDWDDPRFIVERMAYIGIAPEFFDARRRSVERMQEWAVRCTLVETTSTTKRSFSTLPINGLWMMVLAHPDRTTLEALPYEHRRPALAQVAYMAGAKLEDIPVDLIDRNLAWMAIEGGDATAPWILPATSMSRVAIMRAFVLKGITGVPVSWLPTNTWANTLVENPTWIPFSAYLLTTEQWFIILTHPLADQIPMWLLQTIPTILTRNVSYMASICICHNSMIQLVPMELRRQVLQMCSAA